MAIKFTETTQVGTIYNVDEVAAFDPETEAELIKANVAEAVDAPKDKGGSTAAKA